MYQNIKLNSVRSLDSKLYSAHYYDFMLHRGEIAGQSFDDIEGLAIADFSSLHIISGVLYSTVEWSDAINNGVDMKDIGWTGVDNGLITFDKTRVSNKEFLNIYLNSEYAIESGDTRLFLTPVTGNTQQYSYPMYLMEDGENKYISFQGGFYQGFFKLYGFDYEVIPSNMNSEMVFHFDIRPRSDYSISEDTVNTIHPENNGIFFFIGTRAENKFWPFYKTDSATTKSMRKVDARSEGYFDAESCPDYVSGDTFDLENNVVNSQYLMDELPEEEETYFDLSDGYMIPYSASSIIEYSESSEEYSASTTMTENYLSIYGYKPESVCGCKNCSKKIVIKEGCDSCCGDYFGDEYYEKGCGTSGKAIDDGAIEEEVEINPSAMTDSNGNGIYEKGYYEIETDNKFLIFDRTKDGFTTRNWEEGTKVVLTGRKNWPNTNLFLLMNRTCTGYTVNTISNYNEENANDYSLYKDIRNNVFALRVTENGAIGYRYGMLDCSDDNENRYTLVEEYSKDGIVKPDEWNSINVRFSVINPATDKCDTKTRKMRILFYVNGFLVFISKELDTLKFKELDDDYVRQEAVPYNISLGGGSIGLLETILPNYYKITEYVLPIEKDFCGTFIGDIKSFKIYKGFIDYSSISNYLS